MRARNEKRVGRKTEKGGALLCEIADHGTRGNERGELFFLYPGKGEKGTVVLLFANVGKLIDARIGEIDGAFARQAERDKIGNGQKACRFCKEVGLVFLKMTGGEEGKTSPKLPTRFLIKREGVAHLTKIRVALLFASVVVPHDGTA